MSEANEDKVRRQTPSEPEKLSEIEGEGTLPPPDSIISEDVFTAPSGRQYRILHTDETDADEGPTPPKRKRKAK